MMWEMSSIGSCMECEEYTTISEFNLCEKCDLL